MDTCSRLREPGGVGWKDVSVVCLRTTTNGKRLICGQIEWPLGRIGGRGTWLAGFGLASLGEANGCPAGADGGGSAPHNAGDAAVGGPGGGDRSFAARERAAAYGARYFKMHSGAPVRRRNSLVLSSAAGRVAAVRLLEAQSPL